jgi:hypothetical protein
LNIKKKTISFSRIQTVVVNKNLPDWKNAISRYIEKYTDSQGNV